MTLKELASHVYDKSSSAKTKSQVEEHASLMFTAIVQSLQNNEEVKIKGFGTFKVIQTKGVMRKLPGQTEAKFYPAKRKIKFVPSSKFVLN